MLEGMANHQARAVQARGRRPAPLRAGRARGGLPQRHRLSRAPARREHRARELPAPPLRPRAGLAGLAGASGIASSTPSRSRPRVSDAPRRVQDRRAEAPAATPLDAPFENEPDTDWTLAANRALDRGRSWAAGASARRRRSRSRSAGDLVPGARQAEGHDPSRPGHVAYRYALASAAEVDRALAVARGGPARLGRPRRRASAARCSKRARASWPARRGELIGAMVVDGGKTVDEADAEVSEAVDFARYYARVAARGRARRCATAARAARRGRGDAAVELPARHPRRRRARGACRPATPSSSSPRPRRCSWAGGWRKLPLGRGRAARGLCSSSPAPTTRSAARWSRTRGWAASFSRALSRPRASSSAGGPTCRSSPRPAARTPSSSPPLADRDLAIRDLVRSAFGHAGQKCSAASLAICEAEVYDDAAFRRQLRDAAASLPVGGAWDLDEPRHAAHPAARRGAPRARSPRSTRARSGCWSRAPLADNPRSGRPASSSACSRARSSTRPSASAPCWA